MTIDSHRPRPRGRPRKPKATRPPRNPPLPFQATRDKLAAQLRRPPPKTETETETESPLAPTQQLVGVANEGLVSIQRAIAGPLGRAFRLDLTPEQLANAAAIQARRDANKIKGLAPNSQRTHASDWLTWLAFCAHYDRVVLPAQFDDVAEFIHQLIAAGRKKATIEHILWSIANVHRRHACLDPMDNDLGREFWRDRVREDLDGEQHQAAPLRNALLKKLVAGLATAPIRHRRIHPSLASAAVRAQERRRLRDTAVLYVSYDLLARASELVSLEWDRVSHAEDGSGSYRMGKTKTDKKGKGKELYLQPCTMAALRAWRESGPPGPYVFHAVADDLSLDLTEATGDDQRRQWEERIAKARKRERQPLTPREVSTVMRRACALAGVDLTSTWLSGHSARVGAAQDMVEAGLTTAEIQIAGRWASERMPVHYAGKMLVQRSGKKRFDKVNALDDDSDT